MHSSPNLPRLGLALLAAAVLAGGAVTSAARADSFAYLQGGDVWLTTTDAARQFQVTTGGGYSTVSQADDGTLFATFGTHLRRLDRYGNLLSEISTPVSTNPAGSLMTFYGPFDADVSPDGTKAAYGFNEQGFQFSTSCGCIDEEDKDGAAFTSTTALTGFTDAGYKYATGWSGPEWIDNQTVLVSNGPGWPSDPFAVETVGSGDPKSWFTDPDNMHPMEATISRDKHYIAAVHGPDRGSLALYVVGDKTLMSTAQLRRCLTYSDTAAGYAYNSPTFNADGSILAWGSGKGLDIAPVGNTGADGCPAPQGGREVLPGASNPDWGPADVPASRPAAPAPPSTPGAAPQPAHAPVIPATPKLGVRLAKASAKTVTLAITAPAAGKLSATVTAGRQKLGQASTTAKSAGAVTLKVKLRRTPKHAVVTVVEGSARATAKVR